MKRCTKCKEEKSFDAFFKTTKVRFGPHGDATYIYGNTVDDKTNILGWTMLEMPKEDIDQRMAGLSAIAFIKYYFGIKDGEELE